MSTEENVKKEEENPIDEVENSARTINILFQHFRALGYKLAQRKKKSPIRVLEALLFDGLEDVELVGSEEKNLLDISKQILYHRNILINYAIEKQIEKEGNKNEQEQLK